MEHVNPRRERLLGYLVLCALIWVGLHAVTAVRNFFVLFDCAFSGFVPLALILGAVYLLSLLAVNVMTYAAASRTAAGVFMKFWAVCGVLVILSFSRIQSLLVIPLLLLTPCLPMFWLQEWMDTSEFGAAVFLVCFVEFLYYFWIWCRMRPRGEANGCGPEEMNEKRGGA